jgi:MFS family permease
MEVTLARPETHRGRKLMVLCAASAGWAFSFGLGAPLASLWLHDAGCSAKVVGLNTSVYYLGVALASLLVPWLMRRASHTCVFTGMIVDGLTTALFPWGGGATGWFLLRLLSGVASALSLIPMETLINHHAPPERRAWDFGLYAFCVAAGIGLGSLLGLSLYPHAPRLAFTLGGLVTLAAAVLTYWGLPAESSGTEETSDPQPLSLVANSLSFGTAWAQGFLEGAMLTFLSIYLLALGYGEGVVSSLVGVVFLGVILAQMPVAWLADRLGRIRVLLACHALLLAGLAGLPWCQDAAVIAGFLFLLGACCGALYPLGLALLGERLPRGALARANAWYLASNCAGSLSGPVLTGVAIDLFGQQAQFAAGGSAVVLVVLVWSLSCLGLRRGRAGNGRHGKTTGGLMRSARHAAVASSPAARIE